MAVTVQQEVAALYSAIFNRAPDQEGLNNWVNLIQGGASLSQAAEGFVQHPVFTELYAGLTNIQFVQQLYINVLGSEGDAKGIQNWANLLASGVSKAQVVADFVQGALSVDLDAMLASGELTQAEFDAAVIRQDTLTNKANVGVYFAETFGAASNLDPATDTSTVAGLQADPAYLASQAAIANVTADAATVTAAQGRIDVAVGTNDPAGSLVGQNSELTAALVDLQEARADQADALEALAIAVNDALPTPKTGDALKSDIAAFNDTKADDAILAAQNGVPTAQAAVANANVALNNARAITSDAALAQAVTTATANVKADTAAKALFDAVTTANAALASNIAGAGSDQAVLEGLRDALVSYVNAGGKSTDSLTNGATVATLLDSVNAVLNPELAYADAEAAADAYEQFVAGFDDQYSILPVTGGSTGTPGSVSIALTVNDLSPNDTIDFAVNGATDSFTITSETNVAEIVASINGDSALNTLVVASEVAGELVLTAVDVAADVTGEFVDNDGSGSVVGVATVAVPAVPGTPDVANATDAQKALQAAIDKVDVRDGLYEAAELAENTFAADDLGLALRNAEKDVVERQELIDAVPAAQEAVVTAQAYLEKMTGLYGTYTAAENDEAAALAAIEALDVSLNETVIATVENDLFVADLSATPQDYSIAGFGVAGDDQLFIGTGYQFGGATSETVTTQAALLAGGSTSTLEVFFEQSGSNTIVHIETKAFANGAATPANDLVSIELTGVTAADLVFENGFVSFA